MDVMMDSLLGVLTFRVLLLILVGTLVGIIVGALPGINAPTGIALAIPLTFTFSAAEGLILLGTIYCASIYGGSISAILMNVPGEPADVVTCFDGYPMAKKGEPQRALNLAAIACAFGSLTGFLALLFLAPPLSQIALLFGPTEIFWVAIFGMTVIGAISRGNIFNGLLGGTFGMLLATRGPEPGHRGFTVHLRYSLPGVGHRHRVSLDRALRPLRDAQLLQGGPETRRGAGHPVETRSGALVVAHEGVFPLPICLHRLQHHRHHHRDHPGRRAFHRRTHVLRRGAGAIRRKGRSSAKGRPKGSSPPRSGKMPWWGGPSSRC